MLSQIWCHKCFCLKPSVCCLFVCFIWIFCLFVCLFVCLFFVCLFYFGVTRSGFFFCITSLLIILPLNCPWFIFVDLNGYLFVCFCLFGMFFVCLFVCLFISFFFFFSMEEIKFKAKSEHFSTTLIQYLCCTIMLFYQHYNQFLPVTEDKV